MITYNIKAKNILDWNSFHKEFRKVMSFPDYYGENMNAWIDCVEVLSNEPTLINIKDARLVKEQAPDILEAILEGAAFINYRKIEAGEKPTLILSMHP